MLLERLVGGERGQNREVLPPLAAHYIYYCTITHAATKMGLCTEIGMGIARRICGVWEEPNMTETR